MFVNRQNIFDNIRKYYQTFLIPVLIVSILLSLKTSMTLAYYTTEITAENIITSSEVKVKLINHDENNADMPETVYKILPGKDQSNIVSVMNISKEPIFVRVSVKSVCKNENDEILDDSGITYNINTADWTLIDGFWYYKEAVGGNSNTSILYDTISFSDKLDNRYKKATLDVQLTVEAVQSVNNGSVFSAEGWEGVEIEN